MTDPTATDRRNFLKVAGAAAAAGIVVAACDRTRTEAPPAEPIAPSRDAGLPRATLEALAAVVLPSELGPDGRRAAVNAFVTYVNEFAPAAEEMHGYGYPEIRRLPADPAPAWKTQLAALDAGGALAVQSPTEQRRRVEAALVGVKDAGLPHPLAAPHVAIALLSHWASSPDGWDLGFEARIRRDSCRVLDDAPRQPLPLAPKGLA